MRNQLKMKKKRPPTCNLCCEPIVGKMANAEYCCKCGEDITPRRRRFGVLKYKHLDNRVLQFEELEEMKIISEWFIINLGDDRYSKQMEKIENERNKKEI